MARGKIFRDLCMRNQGERFDSFLEEKEALKAKLEENFYEMLEETQVDKLTFVKEAGRMVRNYPENNRDDFKRVLNYLWNEVYSCAYFFEEVLDALCDTFPEYERIILKYAYEAFMNETLRPDDSFVLLLERMADYDEIDECPHFSSSVDEMFSTRHDEPVVDITERLDEIFDALYPFSPMADVVWILHNRFGVIDSELDRRVFEKLCVLYSVNELKDLVYENCFKELFKIPEGYDLFHLFARDIIFKDKDFLLKNLIENFGICVDVSTKHSFED